MSSAPLPDTSIINIRHSGSHNFLNEVEGEGELGRDHPTYSHRPFWGDPPLTQSNWGPRLILVEPLKQEACTYSGAPAMKDFLWPIPVRSLVTELSLLNFEMFNETRLINIPTFICDLATMLSSNSDFYKQWCVQADHFPLRCCILLHLTLLKSVSPSLPLPFLYGARVFYHDLVCCPSLLQGRTFICCVGIF